MQVRDPQFRSRCLVYAGLALITLALYMPAWQHSFIEYDDQEYVTENPRVQAGLTWAGFVWAFGFHAGNWHPLAWLSHMLDCQLFDARAGGHHLTSILLHTGTTLLVLAVLRRMTGRLWPSAAVAALFAWHPLHVESVAWVAERKDVLCAFFWMLSLWCYTRYAERPSVARYLSTLGSFALCLMAKPMAVTLPFVLLLLDYWPLGRVTGDGWRMANIRRLVVEKIPFFALALGGCALTLAAQQLAIVSTAGLPVSQRIVHAVIAYSHYFWATFLPRHLAIYYPYDFQPATVVILGSLLTVVLISVLAAVNFRRRPYLLFGWLWFLGTLVPVIGLVQVGDQNWADRYTYLPAIGLYVMLVWLAFGTIKNRIVLPGIAALATVGMLTATSVQLSYWKNTRTLFEHTAQVTEKNSLAICILGSLLAQDGKLAEAVQNYQTALRYHPGFPEAHFYLGNALDQQGKMDEAVAEYEKTLSYKPMQEQTHIFLAIALAKQKKYDEAITHYAAVLKLDPDSAVTHNNLARILHTQGKFDEAIVHYQAALEIDPKLSIAHNNLGILLVQQGHLAEGTQHLRKAIELKPKNTESRFNLARALNQQGQWDEAANLFQGTIKVYAADPRAHFEYGSALGHLKKSREAVSEFASALLLQPEYPDALDGLAWILSTDAQADLRNGTEAVKMAEQACALTERKDAVKLKTLAAAYAEAGRFSEATSTAQEAQAAATQTGLKDLAGTCQAMQEYFRSGKPWR